MRDLFLPEKLTDAIGRELGRKLHRKIARLFAAQNAIHISRSATVGVYRVG